MKTKHVVKGILSVILTLAMVFGALPTDLSTAGIVRADAPHNHESFTEWANTGALPSEAGSYYLSSDVSISRAWTINSGVTINLCLNGHGIRMTGNDNVIKVKGTLNLYDCGTTEHSYTLENGLATVDTVFDADHDKFTGGYITGGSTSDYTIFNRGGGVNLCSPSAEFNMYGGRITGNTANQDRSAGGVHVLYGTTFTMAGGVISGNTASGNNSSSGVIVTTDEGVDLGVFNISGNPVITDEVYFPEDEDHNQSFITLTGAITNTQRIKVRLHREGKFAKNWNTYMSGQNPSSYFDAALKSGTQPLAVTVDQDSDARLGNEHVHNFTYSLSSTRTIHATCDAEGCPYPSEGFNITIYPPNDLAYDGEGKPAGVSDSSYNNLITYTKDGSAFTGTPTDPGIYTANLTLGEVTASVTYTIAAGTQAAPTGIPSSVEIPASGTSVDITGVTTQMEYSTNSGSTWTSCTGTSITATGEGTYLIRYKATANTAPSPSVSVIVTREGNAGHILSVTGGTGSGSYEAGTVVDVSPTVASGERFRYWEVTGISLTDEQKRTANLSFSMPNGNVSLNAVCEDKPLESIGMDSTISLYVGESKDLSFTFDPVDVKSSYRVMTLESVNPSIATVSSTGRITGVSEGQTTVNAYYNNNSGLHSVSCLVTVTRRPSGGGSSGGTTGGGSSSGGSSGGSSSTGGSSSGGNSGGSSSTGGNSSGGSSGGSSSTGGGNISGGSGNSGGSTSSSSSGGDSDSDKPADTTRPEVTVDVTKDPSEGKTPAGKEETSTVTGKDGSTTETTKVNNTDGSTTEKEKVTAANGTVSEKTTVTEKDGTVKTQETVENTNGSKTETATEVKSNGDFETKTVTTTASGKTKEVVETKSTDEAGVVTETKDTVKTNGASTEESKVTQPGGDYKSEIVQKDAKGEVTKTVTETRSTSEKTGDVTIKQETVNSNGATEESKVVTTTDGTVKKASVTETSSSGKTATVELKTDKNGDIVVKNIDSTKSTVTIPDTVVDADGKAHEVTTITAKALSGESKVKTLVVGKNVDTVEKNALKGSSVTTIELSNVPKFEKNSLKTDGKLTIVVHTKAQAKAVQKQLKRAGAPNAKVKIEKKK